MSARQEWANLAAQMRAGGETKADIARVLRERFIGLSALAALRHAHGWTQDQAAKEWTKRWPTIPKTYKDFSDWETGRHTPSLGSFDRLAQLYECDLADLLADRPGYRPPGEAAEAERSATALMSNAHEPRAGTDLEIWGVGITDADWQAPWLPSRTTEMVNWFTSMDLRLGRREAARLIAGVAFGAALLEPVERWLLAADRPARTTKPNLTVGEQELAAIERSARLFRSWDDHFGGGLRRKAVIGQLNEVADILHDQHDGELSRRLFGVMADLTETAATMSWDSGLHGAAQRYYLLALQAAKVADDRAFGANVLAAMARQQLYIDKADDALELVRLGQEGSAGQATPTVRAMLHTREAWAYAKQGRINAFRRATAKAEDALADSNPSEDPYWIGYFDPAELAGVTGGRLLELAHRRPELAEDTAEHISRAVALRRPRSLRSLALDQVGLAEARFLQAELDEAARLGHEAADVAERTRSDRVRVQLVELYQQTDSYSRTPVVAELRDRVRPMLQSA